MSFYDGYKRSKTLYSGWQMRDSCSVPNEVIIDEVIVAIHDVLNIQSTSIHFTLRRWFSNMSYMSILDKFNYGYWRIRLIHANRSVRSIKSYLF